MIKLSPLLKLLGDESRLKILSSLKDTPCFVSELIPLTGLSQSLISHHLKDLRDGGLVLRKKEGKWVSYFLTSKGERTMVILGSIS